MCGSGGLSLLEPPHPPTHPYQVLSLEPDKDDLVWVQDYHLMLLPRYLRERMPSLSIGWFLHTPFCTSEMYRTLGHREEILRGVLSADLRTSTVITVRDRVRGRGSGGAAGRPATGLGCSSEPRPRGPKVAWLAPPPD